MSIDSLFKPEEPKEVDEGAETESVRRERQKMAHRLNLDQRTTVAGNKEQSGTREFRSVLGR